MHLKLLSLGHLWISHCKNDKILGAAVQGDIVVGQDITRRHIAVMGVEEIGQIVFGSSDGRGSSPDLHKLSFSAIQLCLPPLLLAPIKQVDVKHWLEQLNHPDDGVTGS